MKKNLTIFILVIVSTFFLKCKSEEPKLNRSYTAEQIVDSIQWINQACVKLKINGLTIYIDPYTIKNTDLANVILITHTHGDHFSPSDIEKIATVNTTIYAPADCNYKGTFKKFETIMPGDSMIINDNITVKAVPAYNVVKTNFHSKSKNWLGYIIRVNNITIYHAGDTERIPEMQTFSADIALVPLGQTYTMNSVEEAAEAVKDVKAKIAIPIHFGLYEGKVDDAQKFKTLLEPNIKVIIKNKK